MKEQKLFHKNFNKKNITFKLYVLIISRMRFRMKPHYIVCLNVKELLPQNRHEIWLLSDCNWIGTYNHLVRKRTLNRLARFWVRVQLQSLKSQISCLFQARSSLIFRQTIESRFTLKRVREMIKTFSQMHRTDKYSQRSSIICRPAWLNGWVFVYKLSGCVFNFSYSHL